MRVLSRGTRPSHRLATTFAAGAAALLPALASAQEAPTTHHAAVVTGCPERPSDGEVGAALVKADAARPITINTSHVEYSTRSCAQRGALVASALEDPASVDALVLVFDGSSRDEASARFRDTLRLARATGVRGVAVLADARLEGDGLPPPDDDIRKALFEAGFDGDKVPIIRGSALGALACDDKASAAFGALHGAVVKLAAASAGAVDAAFLLPVDEVGASDARGTVATGRIETGVVAVGDEVELVGYERRPLRSTITGIEMFRKLLDRGQAGDSVALTLRGIDKKDIRRGMVIAKPGSTTPHTRFVADVYVLRKEEGGRHTPFHNKYRPQFYFRTGDVAGEVTLDAALEELPEGTEGTISVGLIVPIAMDKGLRFAIREGGRTVGAGQVTEIVK